MRSPANFAKRRTMQDKNSNVTEMGIILGMIVAVAIVVISVIGPDIQRAVTEASSTLR